MSENSSIEWTTHTFNPWRGCTMVSPGCAHCYAARDAVRFPGIRGIWGDKGTRIVAVPDAWKAPVKWNRQAAAHHSFMNGLAERPRVFCASLADVFEDWQGDLRFPADIAPDGWVTARWNGFELVREFNETPMRADQRKATMDDARTELFRLIEATPNLDWLLLTKRPQNVMRMIPEHWREKFPANVWMGTTVEDQQRADERIPELLKIPAAVRFLSCEPLLGPIAFRTVPGFNLAGSAGVELLRNLWVIAGGESGPQARPMHPDWARSLRDQCQAAGVPFLFKQWGEYSHDTDHPIPTKHPGKFCYEIQRVGKKKAGRLLDGREWNEFPTTEVAP